MYGRMPEVEKPDPMLPSLRAAIGNAIRVKSYLPFCAYAFLLALFTGGCPILFGMIEKSFLRLSDGTVMLLANLRLLGSLIGFYIGGKVVERYGTKPMFLSAHFGFGAILFLFLWRDASGGSVVTILALLEALFGILWAASSVAFIVEMYALIPPENKSLTTSMFFTLQGAGTALGGMLPAWAIQLGMFRENWTMAGAPRSDYDALLVICGTLVVEADFFFVFMVYCSVYPVGLGNAAVLNPSFFRSVRLMGRSKPSRPVTHLDLAANTFRCCRSNCHRTRFPN